LLLREDPGTTAVAGGPSNAHCCWRTLLLLTSLQLLLVRDAPSTSAAVAGVPWIAINPALLASLLQLFVHVSSRQLPASSIRGVDFSITNLWQVLLIASLLFLSVLFPFCLLLLAYILLLIIIFLLPLLLLLVTLLLLHMLFLPLAFHEF
jgi:hypothetical protein